MEAQASPRRTKTWGNTSIQAFPFGPFISKWSQERLEGARTETLLRASDQAERILGNYLWRTRVAKTTTNKVLEK